MTREELVEIEDCILKLKNLLWRSPRQKAISILSLKDRRPLDTCEE